MFQFNSGDDLFDCDLASNSLSSRIALLSTAHSFALLHIVIPSLEVGET